MRGAVGHQLAWTEQHADLARFVHMRGHLDWEAPAGANRAELNRGLATAFREWIAPLGKAQTETVVRPRGQEATMRIQPVHPDQTEPPVREVLRKQAERWGAPLLPYLLYARRPTVFRGVRGMWAGLDASGLVDEATRALLNRRVAMLNGCPF